jgi:hypothetical protein
MRLKALITGGLGFVGTQLSVHLVEKGHEVTIVDHAAQPHASTPRAVKYVSGDTTTEGVWQDEVGKQDAIINLAGASIFRRWTDETKKLIYDSRILTTRNVVEAMGQNRNVTLCSTSAVGYYGFRGDEDLAEEDGPGDDFLARLCVDWEDEAHKASRDGARVIVTRFGIVLGKTGGALGQMIPAFKRFVGGPLGSGNQWFSWIHMEDLLRAILFVLDTNDLEGPVNLCSPNPVKNKELAKALGEVLGRPSFLKAPGFMIRAILGEFGSVLLEGQRVIPERLLKAGYVFHYPELTDALREIVEGKA